MLFHRIWKNLLTHSNFLCIWYSDYSQKHHGEYRNRSYITYLTSYPVPCNWCLVVLTLLIFLIMELNRYRNCATMCWLVFEKRRRREEPSEGDWNRDCHRLLMGSEEAHTRIEQLEIFFSVVVAFTASFRSSQTTASVCSCRLFLPWINQTQTACWAKSWN